MHTNSRILFKKYAAPLFKSGMKVLEIGPDLFPSTYQQQIEDLSLEWDTLDLFDNPQLTYPNSGEYSFPIPDNTYDVVLSGNVIEHVRRPWQWMPELGRVTKPGGLVITICPVSWHFHQAPVDCWRIYPDGMRALYEEASLDVTLALFESNETPHFRRFVPGISRENQSRGKRAIFKILGRLGLPVERAYDCIAVGRKR